MKLIPNARKAWRMLSVQANVINTAGLSAWATLGDLREQVPIEAVIAFAVAMLVLGIAGRLVAQPSVSDSAGSAVEPPQGDTPTAAAR